MGCQLELGASASYIESYIRIKLQNYLAQNCLMILVIDSMFSFEGGCRNLSVPSQVVLGHYHLYWCQTRLAPTSNLTLAYLH